MTQRDERRFLRHRAADGIAAIRKPIRALCLLCGLLASGGCDATASNASASNITAAAIVQPEGIRMYMTVGESRFAVTPANTEAARVFAALLPQTLDMEELNGNEKKCDLPNSLPADTVRPGTIRTGDILLWGSRTVVVFYETFDSPYAYTRLGRVDDPSGLARALGRGNVRVVFSQD